MADAATPIYTANPPIPIDLFVSKKYPGLSRGEIGFADSSGNLIYKVNSHSRSSSQRKRVLVDSAGNPLISVYHQDKGSWQCFKGDKGERDLIFRAKRTLKTLTRTEFEVVLVGDKSGSSACDLKVKGCPFQKSCTIYKGNSIVAQVHALILQLTYSLLVGSYETSLMYKLRQIYVRRNKFRLTIFPGSVDSSVIVALVVIFLH